MKIETLFDWITTARHVFDLYYEDNGKKINEDGFISVDHTFYHNERVPQILLKSGAFFNIADKLNLTVELKNDDPETPCAAFAGVLLTAVISMEEAAERGLLTEAEAEFYGK